MKNLCEGYGPTSIFTKVIEPSQDCLDFIMI